MAGKPASRQSNLLIAAAAAAAGLRLAALALPGARVWGFDILRSFDPMWIAAFTLLPLLAALPSLRAFLQRMFENRGAEQGNRQFIGTCILLFAAAALLPMKTFFYGDGGSLVAEIYKLGSSEHYESTLLLNLQSAPLAGILLRALTGAVPALMNTVGMQLPETAHYPFYVLSLLGVIALGLILTIEKDRSARLPLLLLISGTAGLLFFFGYVEMYLPVYLAILAYLLAAVAVTRGERPLWLAVLLYAVAVAAHFLALALLPSLLYLLLHRQSLVRKLTASWRTLLACGTAVAVLAAVAYFALGLHHSDSRIVMPLLPVRIAAGTLSYTLLSSWHLLDLVNLAALLALFPILYLAAFIAAERNTLQMDDGVRVLLIALFFFGLFEFFANTSLGLARDWDIAAPFGVMVVLLLYFLRRKEGQAARLARLLQVGFTAVLFMLPWIAVNVSEDASARRFADVMRLDDEHMYGDYALSGYEALRKHALHRQDYETEARLLQRMIEIVGYPEQYRLLMKNALLHVQDRPAEYRRLTQWMLDQLASQAADLRRRHVHEGYAISLRQIDSLAAAVAADAVLYGTIGDVYQMMEKFSEQSGCAAGRNLLAGTVLYDRGNMHAATERFAQVWDAGFHDPRADGLYGSALFQSGREAAADSIFAAGLRRWSDNPQYLFIAASTYLQSPSRREDARALLERALRSDPPAEARVRIEQLLQQI